jgi:hypothetical protein
MMDQRDPRNRSTRSGAWIGFCIVLAILVVGGIWWGTANKGRLTASGPNPSTTGSGSTIPTPAHPGLTLNPGPSKPEQ